jgi:hypothetical protein
VDVIFHFPSSKYVTLYVKMNCFLLENFSDKNKKKKQHVLKCSTYGDGKCF